MAAELIQLDSVVKKFGSFTALNSISLSVYEGEFLALLGPSGCGKTTLLRTIAGFCQPTSGSLSIDGVLMTNHAPNHRPVNTVFQNYALFPHMTVHQNVAFGPLRQGVNKRDVDDRVMSSLTLVGMESYPARYPSQLSGGQQQRVALARAIINQPKVLLLDEPLAALDFKLRKRMQMELKRLQERLGITFVIVTHDQEEALVMADRIVVMSNGHIEQVGTGEEIYSEPASRFVADFIGEANLIESTVSSDGKLHFKDSPGVLASRTLHAPTTASVTVMIRPECIHVGQSIQGDDCVRGIGSIREVVYVGAVTRIFVVSDIAKEIVIALDSTTMPADLTPGSAIEFAWRNSDARILSH